MDSIVHPLRRHVEPANREPHTMGSCVKLARMESVPIGSDRLLTVSRDKRNPIRILYHWTSWILSPSCFSMTRTGILFKSYCMFLTPTFEILIRFCQPISFTLFDTHIYFMMYWLHKAFKISNSYHLIKTIAYPDFLSPSFSCEFDSNLRGGPHVTHIHI